MLMENKLDSIKKLHFLVLEELATIERHSLLDYKQKPIIYSNKDKPVIHQSLMKLYAIYLTRYQMVLEVMIIMISYNLMQ